MKTITTQKIDTFLPVFPGFCGTIFEYDREEDDITNAIEQGEAPEDATYDNFEWDYKDYHTRVAKQCCNGIQEALKESGVDCRITFQSIHSPREYNFTNDSINVEIEINELGLIQVREYLTSNFEEFNSYIKDMFTSGPGFASFYSNDAKYWLEGLIKEIENDKNVLGVMLDFILLNDGFTQEDLYYCIDGEIYIDFKYIEQY